MKNKTKNLRHKAENGIRNDKTRETKSINQQIWKKREKVGDRWEGYDPNESTF